MRQNTGFAARKLRIRGIHLLMTIKRISHKVNLRIADAPKRSGLSVTERTERLLLFTAAEILLYGDYRIAGVFHRLF